MLTHALKTPIIKRASCADQNLHIEHSLCLEVQFESEKDIAMLKRKFEYDHSNYEGHFMNKPDVRVFASTPDSSQIMRKDSTMHVCFINIF